MHGVVLMPWHSLYDCRTGSFGRVALTLKDSGESQLDLPAPRKKQSLMPHTLTLIATSLRPLLARWYPEKPWLWDRPWAFISHRLVLMALERWVPALLRAPAVLTLGTGLHIVYPLRDALGRAIFLHGYSEYATAHLLRALIREDWGCVDVGANRGEYTLLMATRAVQGRVLAFEPVPAIHAWLQSHVRSNRLPNVVTVNAAAHHYDGSSTFFINRHQGNSGLSSLSPSLYYADGGLEECAVPCVTLDTALATIDRVDLIKIDVENHELDVLRGASHILATFHPIIIFEFGSVLQPASPEITDHLIELGYALYCVSYHPTAGPILTPVGDLQSATLARFYTRFEAVNLVAVHHARAEAIARLVYKAPIAG